MLSQCKDAKDNPAALFANCVWSERTLRGLEYRPGPPRIFPPVHIHPSAPGTRAGRHIAMSPECHNDIPNDLIDCCLFQNLRGRRYVRFGASCGQRGERFQEWDMECGMDYVPCREMDLHWPASVSERDLCSRYSASCMAGRGGGPGSKARPDRLASIEGGLTDGRLRRIWASALHVGDGCVLNSIPSRSLGTKSPQMETLRAPPSRGRMGAGNRVCIEMV